MCLTRWSPASCRPAPPKSLGSIRFWPRFGEPRLARHLVVSRQLRCGAQKRRIWGQQAFAILEDLGFRVPCNRWVQSSSQRPQRNSSAAHLPSDACSRTQWPLSTLTFTFRLSGKQPAFPATLSLVFPFMLVTHRGEKRQPTSINLVPQPHTHPTTTYGQSHQSESLSWELFLNTRSRWGESSSLGRQKNEDHQGRKGGLKLNIQNTKIMASGPTPSWQIDGETMDSDRLYFGGGGPQNHCR